MPARANLLFNGDALEAVPAHALRLRRSEQARQLRAALYVIRRKRDGRYLGAVVRTGSGYCLLPLDPAIATAALDVAGLLRMIGVRPRGSVQPRRATALAHLPASFRALPASTQPLRGLLAELGALRIDPLCYADATGLPLQLEPVALAYAGRDRYARPLWLDERAAPAWQAMRQAAGTDGIVLDAISGYRGYAYQAGIFHRKLARGLDLLDILRVNAAPGFSEHHSGRALDIGTPGEPAAEESFEHTAAFAWLCQHAADYGFVLSYPRDNRFGIIYEPWHWCWHPSNAA